MKRAAMIHCANIDLQRYKVLKQRNQLPFVDEDMDDGMLGGDSYTLDHSFRLRLMADLMAGEGTDFRHGGLPPAYAGKVVSNALIKLSMDKPNCSNTFDTWIGVAIFEEIASEETLRYSSWYAGELAYLHLWIAKETGNFAHPKKPVRIFLANASLAAGVVRDRADKLGLPVANAGSLFGV